MSVEEAGEKELFGGLAVAKREKRKKKKIKRKKERNTMSAAQTGEKDGHGGLAVAKREKRKKKNKKKERKKYHERGTDGRERWLWGSCCCLPKLCCLHLSPAPAHHIHTA